MKSIALGLLLGFVATQVFAGEGEWLTDLAKAQEKAKTEKKMVLVDFTGSDWCPPCKALHSNVLTSEEFSKFAKDNLVLVEIDFPRSKPQSPDQKKANKELAKKYEVTGYPTVIVFDSQGKQLSKKVGYDKSITAKDYVADLKKLKA
jgi:protein disulfide-isomerase